MIRAEEWRPILNYEGLYEVSSLGRVRSLARPVRCGFGAYRMSPGRTLSPVYVRDYPTVTLSCEGHPRPHMVSRLVATAFVRIPPDLRGQLAEVSFIDGDPANCKPGNLRWVPRYSGSRRTALAIAERRRAA